MHSLTACLIGGALGALVALEFDPTVVTGSAVYHLERGQPKIVVQNGARMLTLAAQREEGGKTTDLLLAIDVLQCNRPERELLVLDPATGQAARYVFNAKAETTAALLAAAICARRRTT